MSKTLTSEKSISKEAASPLAAFVFPPVTAVNGGSLDVIGKIEKINMAVSATTILKTDGRGGYQGSFPSPEPVPEVSQGILGAAGIFWRPAKYPDPVRADSHRNQHGDNESRAVPWKQGESWRCGESWR
ncbi:MAG: hypothetical protein GY696_13770 [Gammaproteobacteria bacterium]|nr:hypothetical protein [Gammaproteobacteria bacterium]